MFIYQKIRRHNIVKDGNIFQIDLWDSMQSLSKSASFAETDKLILNHMEMQGTQNKQ